MNPELRNHFHKVSLKLVSAFAVSALAFNISAQTVDIDTDDNGIVDADAQATNLLLNADFESGTDNWVINDVETSTDLGPNNNPSNSVLGEDGGANNSSAYQDISLADLGFADSSALEAAIAANAMQVVFGGEVESIIDGSASIQLFFLDSDNNPISSVSVPFINTTEWEAFSAASGIPQNTAALRLSVVLDDNGSSTEPQVKVDDFFLNLVQATDADADGIRDEKDIDSDNDGVADADASEVNLLSNGDFELGLAHWTSNDVQPLDDDGLYEDPTNLVIGEDGSAVDSNFYQDIALSDIGFSDSTALQEALGTNAMQVVFGGLVNSVENGYASIQLTFFDGNSDSLGIELIPLINTFTWEQLSASAGIPAGTEVIRYSVNLVDPGNSTDGQVRLDDLFLNIIPATDSDNDGVADAADVDSDNDGLVDAEATNSNLLKNADFQKSLAYWVRNDVEAAQVNGRNDDPNNILVGEDGGSNASSIYQDIALQDIGFTNGDELQAVLSANGMQAVFGGYVDSIVDGSATLQLSFYDSSETEIRSELIPLINTFNWDFVSSTTGIPADTDTLRFTVLFQDTGSSTHRQVAVDDLHLYIRQAEDDDADGVANTLDIDSDDNGVADADKADVNVLLNGDFQVGLTYWNRNDVFSFEDNGQNNDPSNILIGEHGGSLDSQFYQDIELEDIGLTDSEAVQAALAGSEMQIQFGGSVNTGSDEDHLVTFRVEYFDATSTSIETADISDVNSVEWTTVSADSVIPANTTSMRFIAFLTDSGSSRHGEVKVDNLFINILNVGDDDNDGINNHIEEMEGTDPNNADTDNDGLSDFEERELGTSPTNSDSDGDGLSDGEEVNTQNTNPLSIDSDGDGITDSAEVSVYFSDPNSADTDNDGIADNAAVLAGLSVNGKYHYIRPSVVWNKATLDMVTVEWQVKSSTLVADSDTLGFGVSFDSAVMTLDQTLDTATLEDIAITTSDALTETQSSTGHDTLVSFSVDGYTPDDDWTTVVTQVFTLNSDLLYGDSTTVDVHNVAATISEVTTQGKGAVVSLKPLSLDINADSDYNPLVDGFILQRFMASPDTISADELVEAGEETGLLTKEQILQMLKNAAAESHNQE